MGETAVVHYDFIEGRLTNPDGTLQGTSIGCEFQDQTVRNVPGWGRADSYAGFYQAGDCITIPFPLSLQNAEAFAVEVVVSPTMLSWSQITLVESKTLPFSLELHKAENQKHYLCGKVYSRGQWFRVVTDQKSLTKNRWRFVSMVFTGDDICLFVDGKMVARRIVRDAEIIAAQAEDIYLGARQGGQHGQFYGKIAALRIWDIIPSNYTAVIESAEKNGFGEIETKYLEMGGKTSFLKNKIGPEDRIGKGRYQKYEGGYIYWSADTGAHEVHGKILKKYRQKNGPGSDLGFPVQDEKPLEKSGGRYSRFEGGDIYWSQTTGAHAVTGDIYARYLAIGGEAGGLNLPTSDDFAIPGGRQCNFKWGAIYYCDETASAFDVRGAILERYKQLKGPGGFLGFPISGHEPIYNKQLKPTLGRLSRFQNGTIYWSKTTGAYEVHGAIRWRYEYMGGPLSELGYPVTNEGEWRSKYAQIPPYKYNDFQNGVIVWAPSIGAKAFTKLRLYLDTVETKRIDDGLSGLYKDRTAEVLTYRTIKVDGKIYKGQDNVRYPKGKGKGSSCTINYACTIPKITHRTKIELKIKVMDWDKSSGNDYLGTLIRTFNIGDFWGTTTTGNYPGAEEDPPGFHRDYATYKGADAPNQLAIQFSYSIQAPGQIDPGKHFREQYAWAFSNFPTPVLSKQQYADTFTDVEFATNWWERLWNLFETNFYDLVYRGIAERGNCYGMSLEALFCRAGQSPFVEPLFGYKAIDKTKCEVVQSDLAPYIHEKINVKQGYQLGGSSIGWLMNKMLSAGGIQPLKVYQEVKKYLDRGEYPLLSMVNIDEFRGHTVIPYGYDDGKGAADDKKILVADPNVPWCSKANDPTYVAIYPDNTFKLIGGTSQYQGGAVSPRNLEGTFLVETPFSRVSSQPQTPFGEALAALILYFGGYIVLGGDGKTEQLNVDGKKFYPQAGNLRKLKFNAIPGMARIPIMDGGSKVPELYVRTGPLGDNLIWSVKGTTKNGRATQLICTRNTVLATELPIDYEEKDTVIFQNLHTPTPMVYFGTTEPGTKVVKLQYAVTRDHRGRDCRKFNIQLPVRKHRISRAGAAERGGGFVVQSGDPQQPIRLELETVVERKIKKASFTYRPKTSQEVIRFRPKSWDLSIKTMVVENLASFSGPVKTRKTFRMD